MSVRDRTEPVTQTTHPGQLTRISNFSYMKPEFLAFYVTDTRHAGLWMVRKLGSIFGLSSSLESPDYSGYAFDIRPGTAGQLSAARAEDILDSLCRWKLSIIAADSTA